jgi:hypothetical protein
MNRFRLCLSFLLVCCCLATLEAAEPQGYLVPAGSIPLERVEGRLDHLAVDVESSRLFVTALENHTVKVLDLVRRKRVHSLAGIREPQGLVFVPARHRLIVCSRGDGTCRSFDARTWEEGPWIDLGRNADNVRYDAKSGTIYVGSGAEPGPGLLSAIDLASLMPANQGGKPGKPRSGADLLSDRPRQADPKAEVELPAHPESFQLAPDAKRIFVNVPDAHAIVVVEVGQKLSVAATWPVTVADKNFPMAVDPNSPRLFIACRQPARLVAYDTQSGKVLADVPCVGDSDDLFYDAPTGRIYVIGGEGFVDVFNAAADGLPRLARIATAPKARTGLFMSDLRLLAVSAPHVGDQPARVLLFKTAR